MAEYISVETDFNDALRLFYSLDKEYPKIRRRILSGIGQSAANRSKKSYKGLLQKRSGNLYKSIKKSVVKSGKAVVIYPRAMSDNNVRYGFPLAKGSLIQAKGDNYLTFQVNGKWVKKKQVQIGSHDFVEGPIMKYIGSQDYNNQIDKLMDKEIKKLEKKGYVVVSMPVGESN